MSTQPGHLLRLMWPILDEDRTTQSLIREARRDITALARRHHAETIGPGKWTVCPADQVPGSGGYTNLVLVYEAPARPLPVRRYWKEPA